MSQEDDLRGLAKVMDFMRALSVLFVIVNVYWFCYPSMKEWNIDIGVVDRILLNFQRTTGLFSSILWTKLFALAFLALSCLGTKGVKEEKIKWAAYLGGACRRHRAVLLSTGGCSPCPAPFGAHRFLSAHLIRRLRLPLGRRGMDVPTSPAELDGGCVQQRE